MLAIGIILGLLTGLARWAVRAFFRVEEGHVGILVRSGAAARGTDGRLQLLRPGPHFKMPWHVVRLAPLGEQTIERAGADRERSVLLEDGTTFRADPVVRFRLVESEIERYLIDLENPREHVEGLLACLVRDALVNARRPSDGATGERKLDETPGGLALVRRDDRGLAAGVLTRCRSQIEDRYGIAIDGVNLVGVALPSELSAALQRVVGARSTVDAARERTDAECARRVAAAERGVAIARAAATAVEREIAGIAAALVELDRQNTLDLFVERRRVEVLSQAKVSFQRIGPHAAPSAVEDGGPQAHRAAHAFGMKEVLPHLSLVPDPPGDPGGS